MTKRKINIGQLIKQARKEKKITQAQLAEILERDQTAVSYMESGKSSPSVQMLEKLAEAMGYELVIEFK